jgi:hypothetical protein
MCWTFAAWTSAKVMFIESRLYRGASRIYLAVYFVGTMLPAMPEVGEGAGDVSENNSAENGQIPEGGCPEGPGAPLLPVYTVSFPGLVVVGSVWSAMVGICNKYGCRRVYY